VLPLLLALMLGRRWKAVCGFAATALPIIATSFLLVRWHGLAGFAHAIRLTSSSPESLGSSSVSYMPTIQGMADQLLQNGMSVSAINVAALALSCGLLLIAAVYLRNHLDEPLGFSVMVAVTLLTSYNCSLSDYSLLLLPIFLTISYASGRHMTPAKKLLRYTLACLFIAPVLSFFVGAMAVALFLATIALAVQQVLELRRGPAGVLLSRPAYVRPRLAAS